MGWVFLDPDSEYMKIIQPVQEQKRILGAENFVADYAGVAEGRRKSRVLADYIPVSYTHLDVYKRQG